MTNETWSTEHYDFESLSEETKDRIATLEKEIDKSFIDLHSLQKMHGEYMDIFQKTAGNLNDTFKNTEKLLEILKSESLSDNTHQEVLFYIEENKKRMENQPLILDKIKESILDVGKMVSQIQDQMDKAASELVSLKGFKKE